MTHKLMRVWRPGPSVSAPVYASVAGSAGRRLGYVDVNSLVIFLGKVERGMLNVLTSVGVGWMRPTDLSEET